MLTLNETFLMQMAQSRGENREPVPCTLLTGYQGCEGMAAMGWCLAGTGLGMAFVSQEHSTLCPSCGPHCISHVEIIPGSNDFSFSQSSTNTIAATAMVQWLLPLCQPKHQAGAVLSRSGVQHQTGEGSSPRRLPFQSELKVHCATHDIIQGCLKIKIDLKYFGDVSVYYLSSAQCYQGKYLLSSISA